MRAGGVGHRNRGDRPLTVGWRVRATRGATRDPASDPARVPVACGRGGRACRPRRRWRPGPASRWRPRAGPRPAPRGRAGARRGRSRRRRRLPAVSAGTGRPRPAGRPGSRRSGHPGRARAPSGPAAGAGGPRRSGARPAPGGRRGRLRDRVRRSAGLRPAQLARQRPQVLARGRPGSTDVDPGRRGRGSAQRLHVGGRRLLARDEHPRREVGQEPRTTGQQRDGDHRDPQQQRVEARRPGHSGADTTEDGTGPAASDAGPRGYGCSHVADSAAGTASGPPLCADRRLGCLTIGGSPLRR